MNDTEPASSIDLNPDKPGEPEEMEGSRESPGLDPAPLPGIDRVETCSSSR